DLDHARAVAEYVFDDAGAVDGRRKGRHLAVDKLRGAVRGREERFRGNGVDGGDGGDSGNLDRHYSAEEDYQAGKQPGAAPGGTPPSGADARGRGATDNASCTFHGCTSTVADARIDHSHIG